MLLQVRKQRVEILDGFNSLVTKKDYKINFAFNCDSSNVVYLFEYVLCAFQ